MTKKVSENTISDQGWMLGARMCNVFGKSGEKVKHAKNLAKFDLFNSLYPGHSRSLSPLILLLLLLVTFVTPTRTIGWGTRQKRFMSHPKSALAMFRTRK